MPKPQAVGKVWPAAKPEESGWRVVFVCPDCARHFAVPEAEAPDVRCCPWCGKSR